MFDAALNRMWYGRSPFVFVLVPFSWLFAILVALRRVLYRAKILRSERVRKPVIVVGNISVGGTGKTPLVIWLAQALKRRGFRPGIITRGYSGSARNWPRDVNAESDPNEVGDEAVLLAQNSNSIVVAGPDRVLAAQRAIELGADVVISDDGLQHYRMARDFEIAVIDDKRRFGNGFLLPAGPLRESIRRLRSVDVVVRNCRGDTILGDAPNHRCTVIMRTVLESARSLKSGEQRRLSSFTREKVHAIAGIGNPRSFFDALSAAGLVVDAHPLADHAAISARDLQFRDDAPVLMTEKDAVKCRKFADERCWALPLKLEIDDESRLLDQILRKLDSKR
jgi:tetraacyldisaccharide 4'-kinase